MSHELIDYYRSWPESLVDDFDLYWRICHYRDFDWEDGFAYWSDGSLRKRPHEGERFDQGQYDQALNSLYAKNWRSDPRFPKVMGYFFLHRNVA